MLKKIADYMRQYGMLDGCDSVVIGLSGGADSVCLLNVLARLQKMGEYKDVRILAVHINHGIRGDEALRDEEFARSVAEALNVEFRAVRLDVPAEAVRRGVSEETAGRLMRYEEFNKIADEIGAVNARIAVAHHMDDQAETVLMHMVRGSGVPGLAGMRPVSGNVIRPLLCVSRQELEDFLENEHIGYVTDSTNMDNAYTRNQVRNCIIPDIEKINSGFKKAVNNMASDVAGYVDFVERQTDEAQRRYMSRAGAAQKRGASQIGTVQKRESGHADDVKSGDIDRAASVLISTDATKEDRLIVTNLIKRAYALVHGDIVNLYRVHIEDTYRLFAAECGKQINLPAGVVARRRVDGVELVDSKGKSLHSDSVGIIYEKSDDRQVGETRIKLDLSASNGHIELPLAVYGGVTWLEWKVIENNTDINYDNNGYTKYFDYDMIRVELVLRFRKTGDSCTIDAQGHRKKLKQELIDRKIDLNQRDSVLLLTEDSDVLWAVGVRRYAGYQVSETTKKVLVMTVG